MEFSTSDAPRSTCIRWCCWYCYSAVRQLQQMTLMECCGPIERHAAHKLMSFAHRPQKWNTYFFFLRQLTPTCLCSPKYIAHGAHIGILTACSTQLHKKKKTNASVSVSSFERNCRNHNLPTFFASTQKKKQLYINLKKGRRQRFKNVHFFECCIIYIYILWHRRLLISQLWIDIEILYEMSSHIFISRNICRKWALARRRWDLRSARFLFVPKHWMSQLCVKGQFFVDRRLLSDNKLKVTFLYMYTYTEHTITHILRHKSSELKNLKHLIPLRILWYAYIRENSNEIIGLRNEAGGEMCVPWKSFHWLQHSNNHRRCHPFSTRTTWIRRPTS